MKYVTWYTCTLVVVLAISPSRPSLLLNRQSPTVPETVSLPENGESTFPAGPKGLR